MFQQTENLKSYLYSGNSSPEKFFYMSESNFLSSKKTLKNFLIFQKIEFSSPKLEALLIYQEGLLKLQKQMKNLFRRYFWNREVSCDYLYNAVKYTEIICGYLYSAVRHWEIPCDHLKIIKVWQTQKFCKAFMCTENC